MELFAKQVFHQDVGEYTRLMAFSGSGSVVGAMAVARRGEILPSPPAFLGQLGRDKGANPAFLDFLRPARPAAHPIRRFGYHGQLRDHLRHCGVAAQNLPPGDEPVAAQTGGRVGPGPALTLGWCRFSLACDTLAPYTPSIRLTDV